MRWSVHGWVRGEQLELDLLAEEIRARAGVEPDEVVSSLVIAHRVLGVPVRVLPSLPTQAMLVWRDGQYRILIRELEREAHFAVAHELGHWALREIEKVDDPREENFANRIGAAICAPRALIEAVRFREPAKRFRPLAKVAKISETSAVMRLQVLLDEDRVVVTANHRHLLGGFRGLEHERAVRLADGYESDPKVERVELRGGIDEGRVQLFAKRP